MGNQQSGEQGGREARGARTAPHKDMDLSMLVLCQCYATLHLRTCSWYCAASHAPSTADIAKLRSSNPAQRHCSLLRLLHAAKRGRADPDCAASWVKAGAVQAIIASIAAAPVDEAAQQVTSPVSM